MRISFIGAAREVTGSCFLVEAGGARFLVDCGMHQGGREARERNLAPWPFAPEDIDFVLLTHAHIDHSGLLPRLCALGFRGPVHTTTATADLLSVMLLDSAFIQESEWTRAQRGNRRQRQRQAAAAELLYTVAQAQACLEQLEGAAYDTEVRPHASVRCRFRDAGHILGSAIVEVWITDAGRTRKLVFSGDIGQPGRPIVRDPTPIAEAEVLVVESTYGNRLHRPLDATIDELVQVIDDTLKRRQGNIVIPAFALGRTQELLFLLAQLRREGRLPPMQVFVDSPMADKVTAITLKHPEFLDDETREMLSLRRAPPAGLSLRFTRSVDESMALNQVKAGAIIVAASGMCDAGRIKHHLRHNLGRPECAIIIIGFQAEGTLGRRLVDGQKHVRLFGEEHAVRASVHTIGGLSAHGDRDALLGWLGRFTTPPQRTFVVHGEEATACGFAQAIAERFGWRAEAPVPGSRFEL
ncbi:MBL fold metallo-hydrolase [Aquincola sp. MAHUQ-54]|uniref:MBL fold metallo-hydrolase n=1 Tax=Aquincola agrisoli TaxID=3119538 RepID=A0AAW9Q7F9_9BURK